MIIAAFPGKKKRACVSIISSSSWCDVGLTVTSAKPEFRLGFLSFSSFFLNTPIFLRFFWKVFLRFKVEIIYQHHHANQEEEKGKVKVKFILEAQKGGGWV